MFQPLELERFGDYVVVTRGHHTVRLTRARVRALQRTAEAFGEVTVGTFVLDESDLIAVAAYAREAVPV